MPALLTLSEHLRHVTLPLHRRAERSGIMRDLLRRSISRPAYASLLRNLFIVYEALEGELSCRRDHPGVEPIYLPGLFRIPALSRDLACLHGGSWRSEVPVVPAAAAYAQHIRQIVAKYPPSLAAHAYVRYLGDLSGGQILRGLVANALRLPNGDGTDFYRFDDPRGPEALKAEFRSGLDALPLDGEGLEMVGREACHAFQLNIDLFDALSDGSMRTPASAG